MLLTIGPLYLTEHPLGLAYYLYYIHDDSAYSISYHHFLFLSLDEKILLIYSLSAVCFFLLINNYLMGKSCNILINFDDINYKLNITGESSDSIPISKVKEMIPFADNDLSHFDFSDEKRYILEIFDETINNYYKVNKTTLIKDRARLRIRDIVNEKKLTERLISLSNNSNNYTNSNMDKDIFSVNELELKMCLVNVIVKRQDEHIRIIMCKRRKFNGRRLSECKNIQEEFWLLVASDMKKEFNRPSDPEIWRYMFYGLLAQYQLILKNMDYLHEYEAQQLWPFFYIFHHKLECSLFSRPIRTLKAIFNESNKKNDSYKIKNKFETPVKPSLVYSVDEDFNLLSAIISRMPLFKNKTMPKTDIWRIITKDMEDYGLPNYQKTRVRWQEKFYELVQEYVNILDAPNSEKSKWPLYPLFTQIDLAPFLAVNDATSEKSDEDKKVFEDNGEEFIVLDEILGEEEEDNAIIPNDKQEVREVVDFILDCVSIENHQS